VSFVLTTPPPSKSQLAVNAALLVNEQNDFRCTFVNIDDDFANESPDNAFAKSRIGVGPE